MRVLDGLPHGWQEQMKANRLPQALLERINKIPNWCFSFISLFFRCKNFQCLPATGGMLDQPSKTIQAFDIIQKEQDNILYQKQKYEEMKNKARGNVRGKKWQ